MKKYFTLGTLLTLLALFVFSSDSYAQNCKGKGQGMGQCKSSCSKFVDANGDGKCDSFVDANGDGKCDDCTGTGACDGTGKGKGMGQGKCAKFIDANGDGKCDNFVDANGDGKCDDCTGAGACDGTGKGKKMGQGKGMGQAKCGKACKSTPNTDPTFTLNQNVPNPVTGTTKISFNLTVPAKVVVALYNQKGELVKNIYDGKLSAGDQTVDLNTDGINPGNYFYSVSVGGNVQSKQLIVIK
jgi:hypothetical protein